MSHVRTQIRDRIATVLAPVGTVHKTRVWPIAESALPVILVYTNTEETESADFGKLHRRLQVIVEIVAQATTVDTVTDTLIAGVEAAIGADISLGSLALDCLLAGIEITVSTDGSAPVARARMTYVAQYRTTHADPQTSI